MPLSNEMVEEAVRRYGREYDCYDKLCRYVASKCEREIIRANTLHASVTSRAKAPRKLNGKFLKKYKEHPDLNSVEDALARVTDLAGVRISTYLEIDREKVVEEIRKLFDGPNGSPVEVEKKDKLGNFYRATHCQVALKPDDLIEPYDNLEGLTCEIQVCSLLAHVWNELEHDLVYKPTTGELSEGERDSLDILGNLTISGDKAIKQLFQANAARLKQAENEAAPFQDVYDFVTRIRDAFPDRSDFGNNAGQLSDDLVALGFDTPPKVRETLLTAGYSDRATALLAEFQQFLATLDDVSFEVDPQSSDALLVLVLDTQLAQLLNLHPMGRGRGRPPRIASFASRFKQMRDAKQAAGPAPAVVPAPVGEAEPQEEEPAAN